MLRVIQENSVTVILYPTEDEIVITSDDQSVDRDLIAAYDSSAELGYEDITDQYYDTHYDVEVCVLKRREKK